MTRKERGNGTQTAEREARAQAGAHATCSSTSPDLGGDAHVDHSGQIDMRSSICGGIGSIRGYDPSGKHEER